MYNSEYKPKNTWKEVELCGSEKQEKIDLRKLTGVFTQLNTVMEMLILIELILILHSSIHAHAVRHDMAIITFLNWFYLWEMYR